MPSSEDYSGYTPPRLQGAFDFLGDKFDPSTPYSAPSSLKEAKTYQDVFNLLRKGTNDFSSGYYDEFNRLEIPDYYVPGTDTYLRYNPGDGRIISSTFVQGDTSPTGQKGWIDQTMYPSGQSSTDFRRKTSGWEKLQGGITDFALPFLLATVGIPSLLGAAGVGAGAAGAGAAGAGAAELANLAALGAEGMGITSGITAAELAGLGELGINTAGLGAAGAGAAELAGLADIIGGAEGLGITGTGTAGAGAAELANLAEIAGGSGGLGVTGGAGGAGIADLAAMGIDPQALAAYGGDVASNIGAAGSTGPSLSTIARAANTVRKLVSGSEEQSKGIDPKLGAALGSLVGMGIEGMGGGGGGDGTSIPRYVFNRKVLPIDPNRRPGSAAQRYFEDSYTKLAAGGGISGLKPNEYKAGGRYLSGPGDGMSDNIKANIDGRQEARLADGEFVIPADVVSHIGNGSSNAGAKKLHAMMDRIRHARTGNPKQGKQIKAEKFLPA